MRVYTPITLTLSVDKIEEEFPLAGSETRMLTETELRELVLMIDRKAWDELVSVSNILTRREVQALCRYLKTDSYHVDLNKIERVLKERIDPACFSILFSVWEHKPESMHALRLLGANDNNNCRPEHFPLEIGMLGRWSNASNPIASASRMIAERSRDMPYRNRIHLMGLTYGTTLALECEKIFFSTAKLDDFTAEGDTYLDEILKRLSKADREKILLQLLKSAANAKKQLGRFERTYRVAHAMWGEPSVSTFPPDQSAAYAVYSWWYSYNELCAVLHGDPRRMRFWENYLGVLNCIRNKKHGMLIMRHKKYIFTEFEEIGPIYVFSSTYYDETVLQKMRFYTTSELKSWLYNQSAYIKRETHQGYWESRVQPMMRNLGVR